jgi:hypothetical protein
MFAVTLNAHKNKIHETVSVDAEMKYCLAGRASSYGLNCCQSMKLDKLCEVCGARNSLLHCRFLHIAYCMSVMKMRWQVLTEN